MLKSRLNEEKGARNKHFIHDLFSDTTDGGRDWRLHAKDDSSVRRISEISNTDNNDDDDENAHDWWMELWDKDDWDTRTFLSPTRNGRNGGRGAKISLVRLHDEDSIQRAVAASLLNTQNTMNMDKVNSHGDTRRRTRDAFTTTSTAASQDRQDGNVDALQDTHYVGLYGNTASNHKNDTNDDARISFDTHLNWASTRNPDGVNICHKAHDQGACGACWAFAATGSLEASAARRIAYSAYQTSVRQQQNLKKEGDIRNNTNQYFGRFLRNQNMKQSKQRQNENVQILVDDATHEKAVLVAQRAEREAIRVANLSVQELVDCDSYGDQGCTGGNPLLAFYFIHLHGLTFTQNYPYVGVEQSCRWNLVQQPIATVTSWGLLTPNHEDNMQSVLRNIGPIAVGINGGDPSFLSYSGGIFDSEQCDQQANHALLIVGYGQERDTNGTMVRYWIARNSWGIGWGENGMIRIKRGSGENGQDSVCGIAKSPSVALGGVLLPASGITSTTNVMTHIDNGLEQMQRIETNLVYNHCESIGMGNVRLCNRVQGFCESHHAFIYGISCLTIVGALFVFPLTRRCRRQRRERRHQAEESVGRQGREHTNMLAASGEMSPLLCFGQADDSYGSGKCRRDGD